MSVRQILSATYAFVAGRLGADKVNALIESFDRQEPERQEPSPVEDAREAAKQREAISTLSQLGKLQRAGAR